MAKRLYARAALRYLDTAGLMHCRDATGDTTMINAGHISEAATTRRAFPREAFTRFLRYFSAF